jgi:hypothetical protein
MSESSNGQNWGEDEVSSDVRARRRTLRGGLDPSEMGKRSAEARRERAAARARAAEHDRLTVAARLALALATKLSYDDLKEIIDATIAQAKGGSGHVQVQAARTVLGWSELAALGEADDEVDPLDDLASMTPEQRAVYRSVRERTLKELEELARDEGEELGAEDVDPPAGQARPAR